MGRYASPLMHLWRLNELVFPPRQLSPSSSHLQYPIVSDREDLPLRPERHVPTSIATIRIQMSRIIARDLPCIWCGRQNGHTQFVTQ